MTRGTPRAEAIRRALTRAAGPTRCELRSQWPSSGPRGAPGACRGWFHPHRATSRLRSPARDRPVVRCSSSVSSITALALEERTGFRSEKEHVCGRPHVLRRCGRTLRPDNRCDPGLASVRGRDWPVSETRSVQTMSIKFNDTQLVLLSAASQRDDLASSPTGPKRGHAQRAIVKLLEAGIVKEIRAKPGAPIWRRDEEKGNYGLKPTAAGVKTIAVDELRPPRERRNGAQTI